MIGNNSMSLNQATLIEAVQEWLDKRWNGDKTPKVDSVMKEDGLAHGFTVKLIVEEDDE